MSEKQIKQVAENMNLIKSAPSGRSRNLLTQLKVKGRGIDVPTLDLIGEPLTPEFFGICSKQLELNFSQEFPREKYILLYNTLKRDNWTNERFENAVDWVLRNLKFPTWTIADFCKVETPKVFNHFEYLRRLNQFGETYNDGISCYRKNGVTFYKENDGVELDKSFEKIF